ncbi:MAG TPA: hypothetical protein DCO77_00175 [Nitrospiraceae bacterium]|nr:hypothetical protein [Nitrospiraceae bacterium]
MPIRSDENADDLAFLRDEVKRLRQSLNRMTPGIDLLLKRRGFQIYKKEPAADLVLPAREYIDEYYGMMHRYSFRIFLRDVIKHQDAFSSAEVEKYASNEVTQNYLSTVSRIGLVERSGNEYRLKKRPVRSFGVTLEWYVAEIFKREFGAEVVWGVKFRRPSVGGDYDVIAKFDSSLLYAEVKSSPPKQIYDSEIKAFLDRTSDLSPEIAVFFMDTELRMKDKIVPLFEEELKRRSNDPPEVERMERELFHIQKRIFIVNTKESILRNMEEVFSWYYRK